MERFLRAAYARLPHHHDLRAFEGAQALLGGSSVTSLRACVVSDYAASMPALRPFWPAQKLSTPTPAASAISPILRDPDLP